MKNFKPDEQEETYIEQDEKIRAKKSLGQNFLHAKNVVRDIVEAGKITPEDTVLEIGPGKGVLTEALLPQAHKVIAVEKDDRMIPLLQEKFAQEIAAGKFDLLHDDILTLDISHIIASPSYKLIANIPYYITGEVIRKFLESKKPPERMVLMLQKEVAQRIVARDGKESILSLSVKIYGTPIYVSTVKASCFHPAPTVDSAILSIENISKAFFEQGNVDEKFFFSIIKAGFAHKRKFLVKNLEAVLERKIIEEAFVKLSLSQKSRAEDIKLEEWKELIKNFEFLSRSHR